jgi:ATP adenylyltransferase/5',5'''-P-1,P-4-tetraphosphate phosphorylase II
MGLSGLVLARAREAISKRAAFRLFLSGSPQTRLDCGVQFIFHEYNASLLASLSNPPQKYAKDPLLPPFDAHLHVTDLPGHHVLVNKFMHEPGHIVLSSIDPSAAQGAPLGRADFGALSAVLTSFGTGVGYYNCGIESGCTQLHKHIQFAPLAQAPLFDAMAARQALPFVYRSTEMAGMRPEDIRDAYLRLIDEAGVGADGAQYNFIVRNARAALVPRRKAQHPCGILVNSIGMCGQLSVWEWSDPIIMKRPMSVIADLCVPIEGALAF